MVQGTTESLPVFQEIGLQEDMALDLELDLVLYQQCLAQTLVQIELLVLEEALALRVAEETNMSILITHLQIEDQITICILQQDQLVITLQKVLDMDKVKDMVQESLTKDTHQSLPWRIKINELEELDLLQVVVEEVE